MPPELLDAEPEFSLGPVPGKGRGVSGGSTSKQRRRPTRLIVGLGVAGLLVGCATLYLLWSVPDPKQQHVETASPAVSATATPQSPPTVQYPVDRIAGPPAQLPHLPQFPLPSLNDSDFLARNEIEAILDNSDFLRLLVPDSVIRHIVATVDSLARKGLVERIRPIRSVSGAFLVENGAQGSWIASANADRYAPYVRAAEAIDTRRLVEAYVRLYPLFQQAYEELGYPGEYFNDRLIAVIDSLLDAPEIHTPVYVHQPKVLYQFVDPGLEGLPAGQKILIRVGMENELRLKAKLRGIRTMLTTGKAQEAPSSSSN